MTLASDLSCSFGEGDNKVAFRGAGIVEQLMRPTRAASQHACVGTEGAPPGWLLVAASPDRGRPPSAVRRDARCALVCSGDRRTAYVFDGVLHCLTSVINDLEL